MNKLLYIDIFNDLEIGDYHGLWKKSKEGAEEDISKLALQAYLLSNWWQEYREAEKIIKNNQFDYKDPLIYFFIQMSYMALGLVDKVEKLRAMKPKTLPYKLEEWLDIEYLGRSVRQKEQAEFIHSLILKGEVTNSTLISFIQSNKFSAADMSYIGEIFNNWHSDLKMVNQDVKQCFLNRIYKDDFQEKPKLDYAFFYYTKSEVNKYQGKKESLLLLDALSRTSFMNLQTIQEWLSLSLSLPQGNTYFIQRINHALNIVPDTIVAKGCVLSYAAIYYWIRRDYVSIYNLAINVKSFYEERQHRIVRNSQVFLNYIVQLCRVWQNNKELYNDGGKNKTLYVVGESHSLSLCNIKITMNCNDYIGASSIVLGVKMHHLKVGSDSYYSNIVGNALDNIPANGDIYLTIGEIDTRPEEGIWRFVNRTGANLEEVVEKTVAEYVDFIDFTIEQKKKLGTVYIQGVSAPNYNLDNRVDMFRKTEFLNMIFLVNKMLSKYTRSKGWFFVDVYNATLGDGGVAKEGCHIDGYHLSPVIYQNINRYLVS